MLKTLEFAAFFAHIFIYFHKIKIFFKKRLQTSKSLCIIIVQTKYRGMEQLVARRAHNPKVVGSSPSPATKETRYTFWCGEFLLVMRNAFKLI